MKRFRFTLLAICLVLLWLGWNDISLFLRNRAPADVSILTLEEQGAPREWIRVSDGTINLEKAISTSGSLELDALLVPLQSSPDRKKISVLVETRDPRLIDLFRTYHFQLDSIFDKERFLLEHREEFSSRREVTGTLITGLIASGNRDKLMTVAEAVGMDVPSDVLFISEGNEPPRYRGFFFAGVGLLGLIKVLSRWKEGKKEPAGENDISLPPAH